MRQFPKHISLHLTHNQHSVFYEKAEDYYTRHDWEDACWVSPEQKQKAFETQSVWELQWYPNTPVGFHVVLAADLDVLMAHVAERWPA